MRNAAIGVAVVASVTFLAFAVVALTGSEHDRRAGEARSVLTNCQGLEAVKRELRATIEAGMRQLPAVAYYRQHPEELKSARRAAASSLARFSATDCYALPIVKDAGLRR